MNLEVPLTGPSLILRNKYSLRAYSPGEEMKDMSMA